MNKSQYYVQGMHCSACELLIEKYLKNIPGVVSVKASLPDKTVLIETANKPAKSWLAKYNRLLKKHGYSLVIKPETEDIFNKQTIINSLIILATLGLFYYLVSTSGWLSSIILNENSSLLAFWLFGIVAGFSTCAALVGGLMLSLNQQWQQAYSENSSGQNNQPFVLFNLGRVFSFAILGGALGLLGSVFQLSITVSAIATIIVSLLIIILGLQMLGVSYVSHLRIQLPNFLTHKLSDHRYFQGKLMPLLAGAATFFLPCGFTLTAQMLALSTGSWWLAGGMMLFFSLGTLPSLVLLSYSSLKFSHHRQFGPTFKLVTGMLIVILGLYYVNSQMLVLGLPNLSKLFNSVGTTATTNGLDKNGLGSEIKIVKGEKIQFANIQATGFEYLPRAIELQKDVPTELTISAQQVLGCAATMYLKGLNDEVVCLSKPETKVNFVPKKGTYYISCSMGMVKPIEVRVN